MKVEMNEFFVDVFEVLSNIFEILDKVEYYLIDYVLIMFIFVIFEDFGIEEGYW